MGLIRSGVVVTLASVLFLALFLGNAFLTLSWSLEYDNVKPQVTTFANSMIDEVGFRSALESNYELMQVYCTSYPSFVYSDDSFSVDIPCSEIEKGPENVISYSIENVIEDFYYKSYECSFFECLKNQKEPFVLVSEKAKDYWVSKYKFALVAIIVLFFLLLLVMESKHSSLTVTGILMVVSALPFRKLNWAINLLPDGSVTDLFMAFFTKSYNVFMIMTIIGASLFAIGIAFEFLGFGLKFSKFIGLFKKKKSGSDKSKKGETLLTEAPEKKFTKEEVQEIVREEILKEHSREKLRSQVEDEVEKVKKKTGSKKKTKKSSKKNKVQDLGLSLP